MTYRKMQYDKAGPTVAAAFESRGFIARYCPDADTARQTVLSLVDPTDSFAFGGSLTVEELGLKEALIARGNPVIDRNQAATPAERIELMRQALLCDTYFMSANALSADGQMVNIDGNGNRVAALCYGPKSVIVVAGMNKVCPTLSDAVVRARTCAAPLNSQRFPSKIRPCYLTGKCADCKAPDTICAQMVLTRFSRPAGRIKLILVGEELGM